MVIPWRQTARETIKAANLSSARSAAQSLCRSYWCPRGDRYHRPTPKQHQQRRASLTTVRQGERAPALGQPTPARLAWRGQPIRSRRRRAGAGSQLAFVRSPQRGSERHGTFTPAETAPAGSRPVRRAWRRNPETRPDDPQEIRTLQHTVTERHDPELVIDRQYAPLSCTDAITDSPTPVTGSRALAGVFGG